MKKVEVTSDAVIIAFRNAKSDGKKMLKDLFKDQVALYDDITDRVKSFEDACELLGISTSLPDVSGLLKKYYKAIIANYKLMVITEALNEEWMANWEDTNQYKYYCWFSWNGAIAGFAFLNADSTASYANANFGARLCYKSEKLATYSGKQFIELWNEFLN